MLSEVDAVTTAARTLATPAAGPLVALGVAATACRGLSLWRTLGDVGAPVAGVAALAFRLLTFAVPTVVGGGVVALTVTDR